MRAALIAHRPRPTSPAPAAGPGRAAQSGASAPRARRPSPTSQALAARTWNGTPIEVLSPRDALLRLEAGDIALVRLDIREDLGGIEEGLSAVERLVDQGVRVLNPPSALVR